MSQNKQSKAPEIKPRAPLFESTWLALFLLLRQEWLQLYSGSK